MSTQATLARSFLAQHEDESILVLPNAWDVASARVFGGSGARAIGTTSMGIAAVAGHPDVEAMPFEGMVEAVGRIVSAVDVPVTADMERGWGETPDAVGVRMRQVVGRGAVGINLEDGTGDSDQPLDPPELVAEKIIAVREATRDDIHLVINARTDVFLVRAGDPDSWLIETLRRLHVFRDAGADCLFVPGGLPRETIAILARDAGGPLNVVANPAISIPVVPSIPELRDLGVARVSVGAGAMRATLAYTRRVAEELLGPGTYDVMRGELDRPDAPDAYRMAIGDG